MRTGQDSTLKPRRITGDSQPEKTAQKDVDLKGRVVKVFYSWDQKESRYIKINEYADGTKENAEMDDFLEDSGFGQPPKKSNDKEQADYTEKERKEPEVTTASGSKRPNPLVTNLDKPGHDAAKPAPKNIRDYGSIPHMGTQEQPIADKKPKPDPSQENRNPDFYQIVVIAPPSEQVKGVAQKPMLLYEKDFSYLGKFDGGTYIKGHGSERFIPGTGPTTNYDYNYGQRHSGREFGMTSNPNVTTANPYGGYNARTSEQPTPNYKNATGTGTGNGNGTGTGYQTPNARNNPTTDSGYKQKSSSDRNINGVGRR